jgi:hypothetical protein
MFTINIRITKRDGSMQTEAVVNAAKRADVEHHAWMVISGYSPVDYDIKVTKEFEG